MFGNIKAKPTRLSARAHRLAAFVLSVLAAAWFAVPAQATTILPPDFKTMVTRADLIFRGQVISISSAYEGEGSNRHIATSVTFDVTKTLKGSAATPYVLHVAGGTVGNQTLTISGVPKFNVGDDDLLFVENNGIQVCPLVAMMHGLFQIKNQNNADLVFRSNGQALHSTSEIDAIHQQAVTAGGLTTAPELSSTAQPLKVGDFENQIQQQVSSSGK